VVGRTNWIGLTVFGYTGLCWIRLADNMDHWRTYEHDNKNSVYINQGLTIGANIGLSVSIIISAINELDLNIKRFFLNHCNDSCGFVVRSWDFRCDRI